MKQLVFFASGSGTNFQSVIDTIHSGRIDAHISGLIVNNSHIGAAERARRHNIPLKVVSPGTSMYESQLLHTLKKWRSDLIVLAGFLFKVPPAIIDAYPHQIINIHPSLLPKYGGKGFYGLRVHKAVLQAGESKSGCTVHMVTKKYDDGPILGQRTVAVHDTDTAETLAARVLKQEHELLPEIIQQLISNS